MHLGSDSSRSTQAEQQDVPGGSPAKAQHTLLELPCCSPDGASQADKPRLASSGVEVCNRSLLKAGAEICLLWLSPGERVQAAWWEGSCGAGFGLSQVAWSGCCVLHLGVPPGEDFTFLRGFLQPQCCFYSSAGTRGGLEKEPTGAQARSSGSQPALLFAPGCSPTHTAGSTSEPAPLRAVAYRQYGQEHSRVGSVPFPRPSLPQTQPNSSLTTHTRSCCRSCCVCPVLSTCPWGLTLSSHVCL